MNYLAHAVLSFGNEEILVGNMVSDFVKGRSQFLYPETVRRGITLHRIIDQYTDGHETTAMAKSFFRPAYRLYSGALVDVVYDHFLACDDREFPGETLSFFSESTYAVIGRHIQLLPLQFALMFPYMRSQDWLLSYRQREGIRNSFIGIRRRARYIEETETAFAIFEAKYDELAACYREFFPKLREFAKQILSEMLEM
ncbi:MAG TPA: ACP phosphodiesterase [Chitinophagaceae bacterium]